MAKDACRGNTSTSVEKTSFLPCFCLIFWKHLHERGEDYYTLYISILPVETPPRAWRRLLSFLSVNIGSGNTSTSVEKTFGLQLLAISNRKHLHERGEDIRKQYNEPTTKETPPRAWRRLPRLNS